MRNAPLRRAVVMTIAVACMMTTSACFGSFNVTRKLYGWNKGVSEEKFVRELVFLGLIVVPVYGIAGFIDAIVTNSIEFWTGTNPVTMSSRIKLDANTSVQRIVLEKDGVRIMTLKAYRFDKFVSMTTLRYVPGTPLVSFKTSYPDGHIESHVVSLNEDGTTSLTAANDADLLLAARTPAN